MNTLPKSRIFSLLFLLLLPFIFSERASAGDISITLESVTNHSVDISWENYSEATSYSVYYDYFGGLTGTCVNGPLEVGLLTAFSSGNTLPCGASVFFVIQSDNGGLGSFSVTTEACTCSEADVTGDCFVNESDLDLILDDMGKKTVCEGPYSSGDVDSDGSVGATDTAIYYSFVGQECAECSQETHTECQGTSCVSVIGSGENACLTDIDCCVCPDDDWVGANCGEGNCASNERMEYCNPDSCDTMYRCVVDASCLGTLRGRVYVDTNRNGSFDSGTDTYTKNPGATCSGATDLDATISWSGSSVGSTTVNLCDPSPYYSASLKPGNYSVAVSLPSGYAASTSNPVSVSIHGQEITQTWFGVVGGATITGRIWNNTGGSNPSCSYSSQNGLSRLICATGSGICVTSDVDGTFTLSNVPLNPGGLEVCVTPGDGWRSYCASKTLVGNCANVDSFTGNEIINFGLKQEPAAWFKVTQADMHADGVLFSFIHNQATVPYLIQGSDGNPANGFGVVTAGNFVDLNAQHVSPFPHDWYDNGYDFGIGFEKALPLDFDALWASSAPDPGIWQNLVPGGVYRLTSTIFGGTLHPFYSLTGPGVAIFLVEGDVTIYNIERASWSPDNTGIMIIIRGSAKVSSICDPFSSEDKVDASIVVLDDDTPGGGTFEIDNFDIFLLRQRDRKIRVRGMVYAENGLNLPRDRYKIDQNKESTESFEYQPYFVPFSPAQFKKRHVSWREIP